MNCLDCHLPVLGLGDRHRTSDHIQCQQVQRWEATYLDRLTGSQRAGYDDVQAACWAALQLAGGEDLDFDSAAKGRLQSTPHTMQSLLHSYTLQLHVEGVLGRVLYKDAAIVQRATLRRLVAEACLHAWLGSDEACVARLQDAFRTAAELEVTRGAPV